MNKQQKLVFATNNQHKLTEARQILKGKFEVLSLSDIGCHDDIPETADTLYGNAMIKSRWVKERYGYDCFSDDTGLMVDALDGAPGVYSARYAGEGCTPADNVRKLLAQMEGAEYRKAHFSTVVSLIMGDDEQAFEGRVNGTIARRPSGEGGFGYDPIFIADESGKTFSEMLPEEKNAISHRGRAMRKLAEYLQTLTMLLLICVGAISAKAEQWRLHPAADCWTQQIIDTDRHAYIFVASQKYRYDDASCKELYGTLFRYDKGAGEMEYLNSSNLLSGNTVVDIAYNFKSKYLVIAYSDGDIDILSDNDDVRNVPGLKIANSSFDKGINDIWIDEANDLAYVATNFGYVVVDCKKGNVLTSRNFQKALNSVALNKGELMLAADDGMYAGSLQASSLSGFEKINGSAARNFASTPGGDLYAEMGFNRKFRVSRVYKDDSGYRFQDISSDLGSLGIQPCKNGVLLIEPSRLVMVENPTSRRAIKLPDVEDELWASTSDGRTFWFSAGRKGIGQKKTEADDGSKWSVVKDYELLPASNAFMCSAMVYHPDYGLLVRNHGYDHNFGGGESAFTRTPDLISAYSGMQWRPISATYRAPMPGLITDNPNGLVIDPKNRDHVYNGSAMSGMFRLDIKNPQNSLHMSKPTDINGGYGHPGFVAVIPDNVGDGWASRAIFSVPSFDADGNMWVIHYNPLNETGNMELWVWTPAKRLASTNDKNFQSFTKIKFKNINGLSTPLVLALHHPSNKNLILVSGNGYSEPLVIYDSKGTPDNTSDDTYVAHGDLTDQDGNVTTYNGSYCFYEDMQTGLVWMGSINGVYTLNPVEAMNKGGIARRIKVPRNDGTGLADYLLDGIRVNSITVDGAGRKWFSTSGAGIVCTSADGRTIQYSYTTDNSRIPGNTVYSSCYNPDNNSMMISTDGGLCELFLSGTTQGGESDVKCWPNPVRPDYFGSVTIEGLPDDAVVKIVDAKGNLVADCGSAFAGSAQWDVTNMYRKRVPGGVYFVMMSNGAGADQFSQVAKILVVE